MDKPDVMLLLLLLLVCSTRLFNLAVFVLLVLHLCFVLCVFPVI